MKDILGKALMDYQNGNHTEDIITSTNISDEDVLSISYLFRDYEDMPKLEQKALQLSKGRVLDVGCGAGSHSLYLQSKNFDIKSIDVSEGAIEVCKLRGLTSAYVLDLLNEKETFDTLLLLMNGTGIFQAIDQVSIYLKHLKAIMNAGGQILIDSSDILYMYQDEDGGFWEDTNANYYGELDYFLRYKGEEEVPLKWLYLNRDMLQTAAITNGLKCEFVLEGDHHDYLARLTVLE